MRVFPVLCNVFVRFKCTKQYKKQIKLSIVPHGEGGGGVCWLTVEMATGAWGLHFTYFLPVENFEVVFRLSCGGRCAACALRRDRV